MRQYLDLMRHVLENGVRNADCQWHQTFLSRTLGTEVRAVPCDDQAARCCRYIVPAKSD